MNEEWKETERIQFCWGHKVTTKFAVDRNPMTVLPSPLLPLPVSSCSPTSPPWPSLPLPFPLPLPSSSSSSSPCSGSLLGKGDKNEYRFQSVCHHSILPQEKKWQALHQHQPNTNWTLWGDPKQISAPPPPIGNGPWESAWKLAMFHDYWVFWTAWDEVVEVGLGEDDVCWFVNTFCIVWVCVYQFYTGKQYFLNTLSYTTVTFKWEAFHKALLRIKCVLRELMELCFHLHADTIYNLAEPVFPHFL